MIPFSDKVFQEAIFLAHIDEQAAGNALRSNACWCLRHILRISAIQPIIVYEIQKKVVKFQRLKIAVQTIYYLGIANRFYAKPSFIQ